MALKNRYDFLMIFDVQNGTANGDPDRGGAQRIDDETMHAIVTNTCLKYKIRNFIELLKKDESGFRRLIKSDKALNTAYTEAYKELGLETGLKGKNWSDVRKATEFMLKNYFDVRFFGAMMNTGDDPCGRVTGPVQITDADSISPVYNQNFSIIRDGRTKEEDRTSGDTEMGEKNRIPYALFVAKGHIIPANSNKFENGMNEEDVELLWQAIINMFMNDQSYMRGEMSLRKLYIFKHDSELGNCQPYEVFEKVQIDQIADVPRKFEDYAIYVNKDMPKGVELIEKW